MNWNVKRPFVLVALSYVAGVLAADWISFPVAGLCILTLDVALLTLIWARQRALLLLPLIFLAGAVNLTLHTVLLSPHDLRAILETRSEFVSLRGELSETPYHRIYDHNSEPVHRSFAQVDVHAVKLKNESWRPVCGLVAVSTAGMLPEKFHAGQEVELIGVLQPPRAPVAEGLFDYRTFLRRAGIFYQLKVGSVDDWKIISPAGPPPVSDRFLAWAKNILGLGLPEEDEPLRLLWTMTLGWKAALNGEIAEPFMRSGTMHVFAISGLHIALIAGILVALLRVLQVPRAVCGFIVIPLIWFYTGVTGWQASAIRSTVMMSVVIAGWSLRRPSDLLNSLAVAGGIILLWQPQQIFQASFQLSFFVVLSLALFSPVLEKVRRRWLQADPMLPEQQRPRWQRWLRPPVYWLTAGFTTSLAAWLGSIPLIAFYFHLFTPVSLLANVIVVPLSSLALTSNLASLMVGGWWPGLAELFNHSAWFWMLLMVRVSEWSAQLPGGCFQIGTPSALAFVIYYTALVAVMMGWLKQPRWRRWICAGLSVMCLVWVYQWQRERQVTRLSILPLSGGSAVWFDAPGKADDVLVDCGNESSAEFIVKPFLRAQGANQILRLVLTHGDARSVGGAQYLSKSFSVQQTLTSSMRFRSPIYRQIVTDLELRPDHWRQVNRGDTFGLWTVLHPQAKDAFSQADSAAMVLAGKFHGVRVLLLSDLGRPGQEALLARGGDLRADIVVAGLPVEGEPLCEGLLDAVRPRVVVIADSELPATRRASVALRERLGQRKIPVFYTEKSGAVTVELRLDGTVVRAMDGTWMEF